MSIPTADPWTVRLAVRALLCYGDDDMDRATAERLLGMWRYRNDLTDVDRTAVLDRFRQRPIIETTSGPGGW